MARISLPDDLSVRVLAFPWRSSVRYIGARQFKALYVIISVLNWIRLITGSQWSSFDIRVMWSYFRHPILAAMFWICCNLWSNLSNKPITMLHTHSHGTICFVCQHDQENQSWPSMAPASCEYTDTSSINHYILQRYPDIYVLVLLAYNTHILLAHKYF